MRIYIGADVVPTSANIDLFSEGKVEELIGSDLWNIIKKGSFRVLNLETPITDEIRPIKKCGLALHAPTKSLKGLVSLGINLVTLANNHINDQGSEGITSTLAALDNEGIAHIGAGENLKDLDPKYLLTIEGRRIGFYACAEHEFSIADNDTAGAYPFDPCDTMIELGDFKKLCEYLIVLYHGGKEHYRYPSPDLQRKCQAMIDAGADLIICQHTHCIGCVEEYNGGSILYGQGNFIFDLDNNEYWNSGLLVEIDDKYNINYVPYVKEVGTIRLAEGAEKKDIMDGFHKRSEEIKEPGFIQHHYEKHAKGMIFDYLEKIHGKKSLFYKIGKRVLGKGFAEWYLKRKYKEVNILSLVNMIECEAHRELVLAGLKQMY